MNILLLGCYELGHQPLSLAWPIAALTEAGYAATAVDLALSSFPQEAASTADLIAIAVPMHTALRLGVQAAQQVRAINPTGHITFYGLYAWLNADYLLNQLADSVIAGEVEAPLVQLVQALDKGTPLTAVPSLSTPNHRAQPHLARLTFPIPQRQHLPSLDEYARYTENGIAHLAGYTETSRGCLHTCTHCPIVPVYNGRFFIVPLDVVMADISQQVAAGARHITFGDPDFLNGPKHALKIARALHKKFPHLTFNFTTKVEHILKHRDHLPELRALGATFIVAAFEATNNTILTHLQKGHTVADMETALHITQDANLHLQPTWVAFTPWTSLDDYIHMLTWIREHDLVPHVPAVQLSVRLLIPPHSALLQQTDTANWLGPLDAANFTYRWQHPDPCMDELHRAVTAVAEQADSDAPYTTFAHIEQLAYQLASRPLPLWQPPIRMKPAPPRLTEDWFC